MQKTSNVVLIITLLLGLLSLGIAAKLTLDRHEGYNVLFRSYDDLQVLADMRRVTSIRLEDGSIQAKITDTDTGAGQEVEVALSLGNGSVAHDIASEDGTSLVAHTLAADTSGTPVVHGFSLPLAVSPRYRFDDFVVSASQYDEQQVYDARQLMRAAGIDTSNHTYDVIESLAQLLHNKLVDSRGTPEPFMKRLNGFEQFNAALEGSSRIHCANHAEIYAFFANAAGIRTRLVDVGGETNGIAHAAHAFAESYVAEYNAWAYVDLQLDTALVTDFNGRPLNGIDLMYRADRGDWQGITVHEIDSPTPTRAVGVMELLPAFIPGEATLVYLWASTDRHSLADRISRLFINPPPAFSLRYSHQGTWLRIILTFFGATMLAVACAMALGRFLRGH